MKETGNKKIMKFPKNVKTLAHKQVHKNIELQRQQLEQIKS